MLNSTNVADFASKIEWETAGVIIVNGGITIVAVMLLALLVVGAALVVSKAVRFPLYDVFLLVSDLAKEKIEQYKKSEKNPEKKLEPFCLSMLGLTIRAQGIRGKIMFIALLGSLAALAETVIPNDFGLGGLPIP